MEQQETNIQFNEFIDSIYRKIKSENISELKVEMSSIDKYEKFFLKNYNERKKEGVYYTVDTVSNFISNEVLLILINNYLSQASTNISKFREIEQIFKSNTNTQERISKFLLNATICDPTCGSGVFLLSSVKMIFNIISRINPEIQVHDIKKKLLKNLYGYDINKQAIDLSILKLFKWYLDADGTDISRVISQLKSNIKSINSLINSNLGKYDIIVGNPPYGNILNNNEKGE